MSVVQHMVFSMDVIGPGCARLVALILDPFQGPNGNLDHAIASS